MVFAKTKGLFAIPSQWDKENFRLGRNRALPILSSELSTSRSRDFCSNLLF